MNTMNMRPSVLGKASRAGELLGMGQLRAHQGIEGEDWLFEMVLRLARRVNSLERDLQRVRNRQDPMTMRLR